VELLILAVVALGAFIAFMAGIALLVIYLRASRAPERPVYPAPSPGGMVCPRCGTANLPGATVCIRCGTPLAAMPPRPAMPPPVASPGQPRASAPVAPVYVPNAVPRPAGMPRAWLEGLGGALSGQRFWLQKADTLVGRSTVCDVQIPDPKVSRRHFMIRFARGAFYLQDQQSAQGTWVNGERVLAQRLHNGDRITLGDTVLIFHVEG